MHSWLTQTKQAGFTLIEIMIIAPVVILVIGGFVTLMVNMVGDVLVSRDQNLLSSQAQDSLDRIEQDVRLSAKFLTTTGALPSPQGSNNNYTGTAAFTNTSNTLVLDALATDSNPADPTRWLMYYDNQPNPCGSLETANRVFSMRIVYFINGTSLWRRTYVPSWNLNTGSPDENTICTANSNYYPWQQNSCSPGYTDLRCKTTDAEIMQNVSSLDVKYLAQPGDTTDLGAANANLATAIEATITGSKTTAGRSLTTSAVLRATKLNSINTQAPPLTAPSVTHTMPRPDKVTFSWGAISGTNTYNISYQINGGTWTNTTVSSTTTSFTVDANRGDTVSIKVAAVNSSYTSADGTDTATMDLWTDMNLQNGWANYANGYDTAQYTKSSDGRVFLKGLVRYGTDTSGTVIATLPDGYRPTDTLVFQTSTNPNTAGRIDVKANGDVIIYAGDTGWISLDSVSFLPSTMPYSWYTMNFQNGWTNWGGGYEAVHATKDTTGRVNLQGLAKAGTTTTNTVMMQTDDISTTYRPSTTLHFPAGGSGFSEFWVYPTNGQIVKRGTQTSSYMGLQALYYPGATGSWTGLTLLNSWVNYGAGYSNLQYTKAADGVVTLRGLVKNGTSGIIANLPASARPSATRLLTVASNDVYGRVDIRSDGNIVAQTYSNTWIALNLSYIAQ